MAVGLGLDDPGHEADETGQGDQADAGRGRAQEHGTEGRDSDRDEDH
jgi:hypothetical protein